MGCFFSKLYIKKILLDWSKNLNTVRHYLNCMSSDIKKRFVSESILGLHKFDKNGSSSSSSLKVNPTLQ